MVLSKKHGSFLIFVSCFTYSVAYLGRLSYAANLTAVAEACSVSKESLGMVSSMLFFAYGGGQILHFFLAKYYPPRITVLLGMLMTAACNVLLALAPDVASMRVIWLINGFVQSFFWCNICNTIAKYLASSQLRTWIMFGGFSYCFGTFAVYGLSALFVSVNYKITFYIIAALSVFAGILWFVSLGFFEKAPKFEEPEHEAKQVTAAKGFYRGMVLVIIGFVAFSAVCNSFIRDGVLTWLPTILKTDFGFGDSSAVLITMGLSLLSCAGVYAARVLSRKVKSRLASISIVFAVLAIFLGGGILSYKSSAVVPFILCFVVIICSIYCNGNFITSVIPFGIRKFGNVGGLSALLDAFCYVGATAATTVFGAVADKSGWSAVLVLITVVAAVAAAVCLVGSLLSRRGEITRQIF